MICPNQDELNNFHKQKSKFMEQRNELACITNSNLKLKKQYIKVRAASVHHTNIFSSFCSRFVFIFIFFQITPLDAWSSGRQTAPLS